MVSDKEKLTEIWNSGVLVEHIYMDTFDIVVLKVIWTDHSMHFSQMACNS